MNYYPHHIGDYAKATRHLSWDEDCALRRLRDLYFSTEKPLPSEVKQVCRLVLAQTDSQREAVHTVLEEFFTLTALGWSDVAADVEIVVMQRKQQQQRDKANARWEKQPKAGLSGKTPESGIASAEPRHANTDAAASNSNAAAMPPTPTPTPTPNTLTAPDDAVRDALVLTEPVAKQRTTAAKESAPTSATWKAYCDAYKVRYRVEPVRNQQVNAQLASFVKRLGMDEAPAVAAYYVSRDDQFYRNASHPVNLLLRDAEGLRTGWATGSRGVPSKNTAALMTSTRRHHDFDQRNYEAGVSADGKVVLE